MANFKMNRRSVIRGAGSIAIALPWLEIMGTTRAAAATTKANRFLSVFTPGGAMQSPQNGSQRYWPGGTEAAPILSPIMAPLAPVQKSLLTIRGLAFECTEGSEAPPHNAGSIGMFTGSAPVQAAHGYSALPSIDQVIATRISKGKKAKASLQMGVRWATGLAKGRLHAANAVCFEDSATAAPIPPRIDPVRIYEDLFGRITPAQSNANPSALNRKKSILDFVDKKYVGLAGKLGQADRAKLEQHLEKIREVERGLELGAVAGAQCQAPKRVDTKGYNPNEGLLAEDEDTGATSTTDGMIPVVGKYIMDMMVMAFACDITAVGLLQWADSEAAHTFPWLDLPNHHHFYQHDGGYRPPELETIGIWYSKQHAYLLQEMAKVDMGGHSLLDESVVLFGSELGWPESHAQDNIPVMLAGGGGGLRTGRHLDFRGNKKEDDDKGIPHNNLLVSLLNLFGDPRTTYQQKGKDYCNRPFSLT